MSDCKRRTDPAPLPPAPNEDERRSPAWQLLQRSSAATALGDLDGRISFVNAAFLGLWRLTDEQLVLGRSADDGFFWADPAQARAALQTLKSASVWQGELTARRADGSTIPVRITAQHLVGDDGRPQAMFGNFFDISAERAAFDAWRSEREFTELVLGSAGVLVAALNEEGRFVRFNAECERLSGWRADEILGLRPWDTVLPPEIAGTVRTEVFATVMDRTSVGRTTTYTNEWRARDGSHRLIEWTNRVVCDGDGRRKFLITVGIDVTARRTAERALQRSEQQLRQAQSVARIGSWTLDISSRQLDWSDEAYRLFERKRDVSSISYEGFLDVVHPDDRRLVAETYERSLASRRPYRIEHRLRMPDGRIKWVEERCETEFDDEGRPRVSHGTVQDVTERHIGEVELQRFRHMVEQAPGEVWLTDETLRVVYANAAASASLGYTPEQLLGRNLAEIDCGGEASLQAIVAKVEGHRLDGRPPEPFRVDHRAADGRSVPKEIFATVRDIDGKPHGISFARDISERLRAQQALADSESQLREALDTYPGWVACVDEQMRYVFVNAQFCRIVARAERDIIGRTADEVLRPQRSADRWAAHRRLMAGEPVAAERHFVDPQGLPRIAWVQYLAVQRAAGSRLFYAYAIDVTEQRQAQLRLSTVTQGIGVGLWECLFPGEAFECNDELLAITGHARGEANGDLARWLVSLVHAEDRPRRSRLLRTLADEPAVPPPLQFRIHHKQGHVVWLQEQLRVLSRDARGRPLRIIGVLQDISALKQREAELQQLNADLEQRIALRTQALAQAKQEAERASTAKSEFLSHMSHELRTPLNAIIGFGQLLAMSPLPAEDAEHVQEVMQAGRHLLALIDDILDLATVEAGRMTLQQGPVGLDALLAECMRLMQPAAQAAAVTLERLSVPEQATVVADRGRLRQVLLNLVSNAVKYNRNIDGRVVLSVQRHEAAGLDWVIRVTDNGPGLEPAQIVRLFQPFERLGADRTAVKGTGIGLAISRRLVELMHGRIGVDSKPGRGSTFWIALPAATGEAGRAPAPAAQHAMLPPARQAGHGASRHRILYVEDHESNRLLVQRLLDSRSDIDLRTADGAEDALSLVGTWIPDLLLLDIQLPGIEGHELLRRLRALGLLAPAVAVSANAMPGDLIRGQASGFATYLTKPLDLKTLLEVIDRSVASAESGRPT